MARGKYSPTVDRVFGSCYYTNTKEHKMMKKQFKAQPKKSRFARMREVMAEYGFPLRVVMCGRVENGRFYLTNRTKPRG